MYRRWYRISHEDLSQIHTIEQVVAFVQHLSQNVLSTDQLAEVLEPYCAKGDLDDVTLIRLSRLHKKWSADNGKRGYCINLLWSVVVLHQQMIE